jgi:uncharacterized membrane protein YoaK (UPF0700 family)
MSWHRSRMVGDTLAGVATVVRGATARSDAADPRLILPLLLLTFVTGVVDAASVLGLGRVFTANMTGNVVFLGFALGGAHDASIAGSLVAIAAFLLGAAGGGRLSRHDVRRALRWALAIEVALLLAAAVIAALTDEHRATTRGALLVLLAMPMGLRNAAIRRLAVPDMTTTVLTLTLTGIAADSPLAGGENPRLARRAGAVAAMLIGALVGAALLQRGLAWTIAAAVILDGIALASVLSAKPSAEVASR